MVAWPGRDGVAVVDRIKNPFAPGAGSRPPELAGREELLDLANVLLGRVMVGRAEKSLLMTGLRGVGKTVLLNEMAHMAQMAGYRVVLLEASENRTLTELLLPRLRTLLYDLDRLAGAGRKVRRGLAVLKGFLASIRFSVGDLELGLDIDPEEGTADSGNLDLDLPDLFTAVAEAAQERHTAIALLIDEIQYVNEREMGALVMAMHRLQQLRLPFVLVGAGLPTLPRLLGDARSYAERLFHYPTVGPLAPSDARKAVRDPVEVEGASITDEALQAIVSHTLGYPYFLQEWGYQAWNHADRPPITLDDVNRATTVATRRLDENFFRVRFDRCTPSEKRFLGAMAQLGAGPQRMADIATVLGVHVKSLGPVRAKLLVKGMVYSPSHGDLDFTVPLFDAYMRRAMPDEMRNPS